MRQEQLGNAILRLIQFKPEATAQDIATKLKTSSHKVNYQLQQLKEAQIIRRGAFIHFSALGLRQYLIYFSILNCTQNTRQTVLKRLKENSSVIAFGELGGSFQFFVNVCVREAQDVSNFMDQITQRFGDISLKREIIEIIELKLYPKRYLAPQIELQMEEILHSRQSALSVALDDKDMQIIAALCDPNSLSQREIAKSLDLPRPTLRYRIERLMQKGVLQRQIYFINAAALGMQRFRIAILGRGQHSELRKKIEGLCLTDHKVVGLIECLGSWNFEIMIEVSSQIAAAEASQEISINLGDSLSDVRIFPVLQQGTSSKLLTENSKLISEVGA